MISFTVVRRCKPKVACTKVRLKFSGGTSFCKKIVAADSERAL